MDYKAKEQIIGVLSYPYLDKLVIKVGRQIDRFHVPTERLYIAPYSNPEKVRHLVGHFMNLNRLLQERTIESRIHDWGMKYGNKN